MHIVYGIYSNIAMFEFSGRLESQQWPVGLANNTKGLRTNPNFWRSGPKNQLLYIYSENGSGVVNFDTLRRAFESDSVVRA
jgi:hypothetical protein